MRSLNGVFMTVNLGGNVTTNLLSSPELNHLKFYRYFLIKCVVKSSSLFSFEWKILSVEFCEMGCFYQHNWKKEEKKGISVYFFFFWEAE